MLSMQKNYLGTDVSKLWFDVSLMRVNNGQKHEIITERFDNTDAGLKLFAKWLKSHGVTFCSNSMMVIENTGIYHRRLWAFCTTKNLPLYIGNAASLKYSFGIARGKNDVVDSKRLCAYAYKEADILQATPGLDPVILTLKDLMTGRNKLVTQRNTIRTSLKELEGTNNRSTQLMMEKSFKDVLNGFELSIAKLEIEINKILNKNEAIKTNYKYLISVPGIGHLTALLIITCTANFAYKVSGKKLACYAGVVPFEETSGTSIKRKGKVHRMANKELKKMLHMSSLTAIRCYPEFKDYYNRKKAEGKPSMAVLNAIKNKIILRAAAVVINQRMYVKKIDMDLSKNSQICLVAS